MGPIALTYRGTARFADKDEAAHAVVIDAKGRETRGSGTATAKIACRLVPDGDGTRVDVVTDLSVTGRPAQFGRGVIGEVAGKVITQFADALAEEISAGSPTPEAPAEPAPAGERGPEAAAESTTDATTEATIETAGTPAAEAAAETGAETGAPAPPTPPSAAIRPPQVPRERRSADSIDLLDVAGAPVAKRLAPIAVIALLILLITVLRRRKRR